MAGAQKTETSSFLDEGALGRSRQGPKQESPGQDKKQQPPLNLNTPQHIQSSFDNMLSRAVVTDPSNDIQRIQNLMGSRFAVQALERDRDEEKRDVNILERIGKTEETEEKERKEFREEKQEQLEDLKRYI